MGGVKNMNIEAYLKLMNFPKEWKDWNMLPEDSVLKDLISSYKPGMENASEHDRNGFFHYWLKKNPDKETLVKLVKLSALDPDKPMAQSLRKDYLASAKNTDNDILNLIAEYE